jgi:hypothetical protein
MGMIRDRGHDGGNTWRWLTIERLVRQNGWTKGAELGVWMGQTFTHLVRTCKHLHIIGVDLYAPQPENNGPEKWTAGENGHPWDHETYYKRMLQFSAQYPDRAQIIKGYTTEVAETLEDGSLDFVFIDADHGYEGCLRDIKAWAPKVRKGGYVMGHDIHFPTVQQAVTEYYGENSWNVEDDFVWWVESK